MKFDLYNDNLIEVCKTASYSELGDLSQQIRDFLVEKVSKTGGHLASNLGIVELSIALMRVFGIYHGNGVITAINMQNFAGDCRA